MIAQGRENLGSIVHLIGLVHDMISRSEGKSTEIQLTHEAFNLKKEITLISNFSSSHLNTNSSGSNRKFSNLEKRLSSARIVPTSEESPRFKKRNETQPLPRRTKKLDSEVKCAISKLFQ